MRLRSNDFRFIYDHPKEKKLKKERIEASFILMITGGMTSYHGHGQLVMDPSYYDSALM